MKDMLGPPYPSSPFSLCSGWLAAVRFFTVNVGAAVVMLIPAILFSLSAVMMAITLVKVSWQVCLHRAPVSSGVAVKSFVTWELTVLVGEVLEEVQDWTSQVALAPEWGAQETWPSSPDTTVPCGSSAWLDTSSRQSTGSTVASCVGAGTF